MPKVLLHTIENFQFHTKKSKQHLLSFVPFSISFGMFSLTYTQKHTKTIMVGVEVLSLVTELNRILVFLENLSKKTIFFSPSFDSHSRVTYVHFLKAFTDIFECDIHLSLLYGKKVFIFLFKTIAYTMYV